MHQNVVHMKQLEANFQQAVFWQGGPCIHNSVLYLVGTFKLPISTPYPCFSYNVMSILKNKKFKENTAKLTSQ
jgi:hypothetical protein